MFEGIRYRWRLRKLEDECDKIEEEYEERKKGLSGTDREDARSEAGSMLFPIWDEIGELKSNRIRQIAARLLVPLPDTKDKELWEEQTYRGRKILTSKGIWELKKLIREEKRERRQWVGLLTALITAIAGAIGATAGLVAVLSR